MKHYRANLPKIFEFTAIQTISTLVGVGVIGSTCVLERQGRICGLNNRAQITSLYADDHMTHAFEPELALRPNQHVERQAGKFMMSD